MSQHQSSQQEYSMPSLHVGPQDLVKVSPLVARSIDRIHALREEFLVYFAEELAVMKLKNPSLQGWNFNKAENRLTIVDTSKPQNTRDIFSQPAHNVSYIYKEFNHSIRYNFKKSLNRMYALKKTLSFGSMLSDSKLELPIDVVNLFDYYDPENDESVQSLEIYKKKVVREFFIKYTGIQK